MNFGTLLNHDRGFKPSEAQLAKAGYKQVPVHAYSRLKIDKQWITNVDAGGRSHFPRMHLIQDGKNLYLHCDLVKEHHNGFGVITDHRDPIIKNEINRLKYAQ